MASSRTVLRLTAALAAAPMCAMLWAHAHAQGQGDIQGVLDEVSRLYGRGEYTESLRVAQRALDLARKSYGEEHTQVASALSSLANLHTAWGRYSEAESMYKRSLTIREKILGPNHRDVGRSLSDLAKLYRDQNRGAEAVPLSRRSLQIQLQGLEVMVKTAPSGDEESFKHTLAMYEEAYGREHPALRRPLDELAALYWAQRRYNDAGPLYMRSLSILENARGREHADVGQALNELAELYWAQRRYNDAEPLYSRSLPILENAVGHDHELVRITFTNLYFIYGLQRRTTEQEALVRRRLATREKVLGYEHPALTGLLSLLGGIVERQGRYSEAESLYKRGLVIHEEAFGPDHHRVDQSLSALANLAFLQSDWAAAAEYWRRSTIGVRRRTERGVASGLPDEGLGGNARSMVSSFWGLVKVTARLTPDNPPAALTAEMFETAQWAQGSDAAASLAQVAARSAKGSVPLAELIRERQDLASEWRAKDRLLIAAKSEEPAKRRIDAEKALADRLAAIYARLAAIDRQLAQEFPDYTALASPLPISVADVQAQLGADEALILFLHIGGWLPLRDAEEMFVWVVTRTHARWARSELGTARLISDVAALRCGLDESAWDRGGRLNACLLNHNLSTTPDPLPFDHARAHKLYTALFGQVQDLIEGKHLLIVPSGPLTQLPFHVLVTRPPTSGDPRAAAWLAREHAITVLPAVSSLKALRRVGKPSAAPRTMIGFGNPLLTGYPGRADDDPKAKALAKEHLDWARMARAKQRCPETRPQRVAARHSSKGGGAARIATRSGPVNLADIKSQVPLPETAEELCAVGQAVKAEPRDIHLGSRATEHEVKRLSATGELAKYRMIHFATHGTLAGELTGTHEPGLILTPPETASDADDGYLSTSEIATLKLDADWVVLSACNTAAGGATNAEALSGLGRAFIYAGARSLLVSHWAIYSEATVKLITGAVREMSSDPKVGRSEAVRRSMLALIDKGSKQEAHPAVWAPFVVVGEGAAGR